MHTIAKKKLLMLKPENIVSNPNKPRRDFDQRQLEELCRSISQNGIIQPLIVTQHIGANYMLVSGERRLMAAKQIHLRRIPCIVHKADKTSLAIYGITENTSVSPLDFFEEADAIRNILQSSSITQSELAIRLGISKTALNHKLRLLRLSPDIQKKILEAGLSEGVARALLKLNEKDRELALQTIIAESLSWQQAEDFTDRLLFPVFEKTEEPPKEKQILRKRAIGDVKLFANSLSKLIISMKNSGVETYMKRQETERYIEFRVRIIKNDTAPQTIEQLRIC